MLIIAQVLRGKWFENDGFCSSTDKLVNEAANDSAQVSGQDRKQWPPTLGTNQFAVFGGFRPLDSPEKKLLRFFRSSYLLWLLPVLKEMENKIRSTVVFPQITASSKRIRCFWERWSQTLSWCCITKWRNKRKDLRGPERSLPHNTIPNQRWFPNGFKTWNSRIKLEVNFSKFLNMVSVDEGSLNLSVRLGTRFNQLVQNYLPLNSLKQCPRNVYLFLI